MITSFLTASPATSVTDSATDSAAVDVAETSAADAESSATKFEAELTGSEEFDADTDADTSFESDADTQSDTQPTTTALGLHPAPSPSPDNLTTQSWIHSMLQSGEMKGVGGFSMLCGTLRPNGIGGLEPLAVISNRTEKRDEGVIEGTRWVCGKPGETRGLSNSLFDEPWEKVRRGERLLAEVVAEDVGRAKEGQGGAGAAADGDGDGDKEGDKETTEDQERLLEKCFEVLSTDTYPPITESSTYQSELDNLRESIFIPVFDVVKEGAPTPSPPEGCCVSDSDNNPQKHQMTEEELERWRQSPRLYGTVQQTVVLLDKKGMVTYVERTLHDCEAKPVEGGKREVRTRFRIPGWA
jgi:hypothetical protein